MSINNKKSSVKSKAKKVLSQGSASPLENARSIKKKVKQAQRAHHATLHGHLAKAYRDIPVLTSQEGHWIEFCEAVEWTGRVGPKPNDVLAERCRYFALFIFGSDDENLADRARKYGRVLEHYVRRNLAPDDFAARLKADGGVEAVYKKEVRANPRRPGEAENDDDDADELEPKLVRHSRSLGSPASRNKDHLNDEDLVPGAGNDEADGVNKVGGNDMPDGYGIPKVGGSPATLLIGVSEKELAKVMNLSPGERIMVTVRRFSYPGKLKVLRAEDITKL